MGLFSKTPEEKYKAGRTASANGNHKKALRLLEEAAAAGHVEAQYECGYYYYEGEHIKRDPLKAFAYFRKAAEQGHSKAQNYCGIMYQWGKGMEQDLGQALFWYEKAAEQGYVSAQISCVELYYKAEQAELRNLSRAAYWAEKYLEAQSSVSKSRKILSYEPFIDLCHRIQQEAALKTEDPDKLCSAGANLFREQKYDEAEKLLKRSLEKKETPIAFYYCSKMLLEGLGEEQDSEKGRELMEKAAELGYGEAQYELADLYYYGKDNHVETADYEKALKWYQRAAEQDDARAQLQCGEMYRFGIGTAADPEKARSWYEKAAAYGSQKAKARLQPAEGSAESLYKRGYEQSPYCPSYAREKDYEKAFELLERAGELGHREAQYQCGRMCQWGYGTKKDWAKARCWYEKAASLGYREAQLETGILYSLGQGVQRDFKTALYWYEVAASWEDCQAQRNASEHYLEGLGTEQNPLMALYWMERAQKNGLDSPDYLEKVQKAVSGLSPEEREAQQAAMLLAAREDLDAEDYGRAVPMLKWLESQGCESAKYLLTSARLKGLLLHDSAIEAYHSKDYAQALIDFEKAAFTGHTESQYNCGLMYYNGWGTEKYYEKTFYWYRRAAEQGHVNAQNNLGYLYDFGEGTPKSPSEAFRWYEKAAEQGLAMAQYNCGLMYLEGRGIDQDKAKAKVFLKKASEQGYAEAGKVLAERF